MSVNDFITVLKSINRQPAIVTTPETGAVITAWDGLRWFTGTFAEMFQDSFGETWFVVVSAFEQRSIPAAEFSWQYAWLAVAS